MIAATGKSTVVIVISSERTWRNLATYCFNDQFRINRHRFDLCVTFNGALAEALPIVNSSNPEYLYQRPNFGMDPAALDFTLKALPEYEQYLVLHDDHWFHTPQWFDYLTQLLHEDPTADVYGNLVTSCTYNSEAFDAFFDLVSGVITDNPALRSGAFPYYLQGMAGIFRGKAVQSLLQCDGLPHTHCNNKKTIEVCERLFSYQLLYARMNLKQIPPGYELFLRHRDHNQELVTNHL